MGQSLVFCNRLVVPHLCDNHAIQVCFFMDTSQTWIIHILYRNRFIMIRRIVALILLSGLIGSLSVSAQREFTFKRLNAANGISSNYVVDLAQDKAGNIWIASESGLSRFDGSQFTQYNTSNSDITSNELNAIYYNAYDNTLWVGTQRDGLCVFDCLQQRFTHFYDANNMITNDVTNIVPATDGGLWIVHYHLGVDYYDNRKQSFTSFRTKDVKGLEGNFWCAADNGKGQLLVGQQAGGLSVIDLKTRTCKNYRHNPDDPNSLPGNTVKCIYIDKGKNIWVGTTQGLALFNMEQERFISFRHDGNNPHSLISNQINSIGEDLDGNIWICTHMGGVSMLNMHANTFTSPENMTFCNIGVTGDLHGLSSPNASCFLQDCFGNIWIGNYRGGLDFLSYKRPDFQMLAFDTSRDGKAVGKQVWGIAFDNRGRLWVGGENEVAIFQNRSLWKVIPLEKGIMPYTHVSVIYKDRSGMLWFGMYRDGVLRCDPNTGTVTRIPINEPYAEICTFYEDADKLWIGTQNGLFSCQNDKIRREDRINGQLVDPMVHGILRDRQGKLWVGTFGKGFFIFNAENKLVKRIDTSGGLTSNAINYLYQASEGDIWAATRGGLVHITDTKTYSFQVFGTSQGLPDNNVRSIIEDDAGQIWLSTNKGISVWKNDRGQFCNYTYTQGVPQGDFMDGAVGKDKDGNLYFGSQNGICYFHPSLIEDNEQIASIKITGVRSYGDNAQNEQNATFEPIEDNEVRIPYNSNTLTLSFNVMDFTQSQQVEYAYLMEGLNKTWFETHSQNSITFHSLLPGEYVFKVKARLPNQPFGDDFAAVKIVVTPPFWLTWYAKLLYVVLVGCFCYWLMRSYKRKLTLESRLSLEHHQHENDKKLNNERLRFYTNITHELRTPLTLILGPLEDLLADKTLPAGVVNKISIIHDNANRLLNLINQILEFRKTETENRKLKVAQDDLGKLVQEIGIKYKELNRNPNVGINIRITADNTVIYYDSEIITIIIDNLMSNALKYTPKGEITLSLDASEENGVRYMEITVADTGHGISKESLNHIFERYYQGEGKYQASGSGIGLSLVKSLADLHQATVDVQSEVDKGSRFTLRLLTENTYPNTSHRSIVTQNRNEQTELADARSETKPIILLVEDNRDICEYIRSSFGEKYEVLVANDGKEGWDIASNRIPNIIVSDIMMPVMDGIELCKAVKEDMRTSHIPVILLTAKDTIQDKEEGYAAGADSFITKPFSARLLNSRIDNILDNRKKLAKVIIAGLKTEDEPENAGEPEQKLSNLDKEFLQKVTAIVEEHLNMEKMDLAFIADKMCMSHSTLYRKIKGLTEMSANEFVRKIKIRKSLELISDGGYSIAEIADLTGFSSVAYFRQCFKDEYGVTPTEYLKQDKR